MEDINKTTDVSSFPHWGEREGVQVFVAGPEHEVYVDTILQTIADAAKVRCRKGSWNGYCQAYT